MSTNDKTAGDKKTGGCKCGGKCGNKDCPCSVKDKGTGTGTTTGGNKAKGGDCGCQTKKK